MLSGCTNKHTKISYSNYDFLIYFTTTDATNNNTNNSINSAASVILNRCA